MAAYDKVTSLKFNNILGVVHDNNWISGVEYEDTEDENKDYIEENQKDKDYTEIKGCESKDQEEYLQAEEEIDKYELGYLEEEIQGNDHNPVNEEQDAPIQEYQEEI